MSWAHGEAAGGSKGTPQEQEAGKQKPEQPAVWIRKIGTPKPEFRFGFGSRAIPSLLAAQALAQRAAQAGLYSARLAARLTEPVLPPDRQATPKRSSGFAQARVRGTAGRQFSVW